MSVVGSVAGWKGTSQRREVRKMNLSKFWQAIKDAREGKPLDLSEEEFELFSAIENLGVEQENRLAPPVDEKLREEVAKYIKREADVGYLEHWFEYRKSLSQEQQDDYFRILSKSIMSLFQSAQAEAVRPKDFPKIVCLCGSTRFGQTFQDANLSETLRGKIVLSIGCNMRVDTEIFGSLPERELKRIKTELDELHKRKIDLADEVLVLNVGGYIGESTRSDIEYATYKGKPIKYLEALSNEGKQIEKGE